jgi:hypothetical protein
MAEKDVPKRSKAKRNNRVDMRIDPAIKERWEKAAEAMGGISLTAWLLIAGNEQCKRQEIEPLPPKSKR